MKVIKGYAELDQALTRPVITIGNFDGLHLGHRQIIQSVIDRAKAEAGVSVVYTFRPHPHLALKPEQELQLINTYDEKLDLLREIGVDFVIEEPFSREFSTIAPESFFRDVLVKRLCAHAIHVGYDFGFGRNRSGSLDMLRGFCKEAGIDLVLFGPLKVDGEICSSSRIRAYILAGDVVKASKLLGREFFYRGVVVRGDGRGRTIGIPTANVKTEGKLRVKEGVYATLARPLGHGGHGANGIPGSKKSTDKLYLSVTNVGRQPTFRKGTELENAPVTVETHLLDFDGDLYGETLEVRMVERLRDETRFDGIDSLVKQIRKDIAKARSVLEPRVRGLKA